MRRVVPPAARRIFVYRLLPWRPGAVLHNRTDEAHNATTFPKGVRGTESSSGASRGGSRAEGAVRGVEVAGAPSSPAVGLEILEDLMG